MNVFIWTIAVVTVLGLVLALVLLIFFINEKMRFSIDFTIS